MEKFSFPRRTINTGFITKRNATGNFSDMPSDVVINVDGVAFSLHKFPLLSRSGKIKRLVEELSETDSTANPVLEFSDFPGGPDIFELAAKFCYNINFDITIANAAQLRCAAEFLDMTDDYGEENLHSRTEAFLNEIVFNSVEKSAAVLRACTPILQHAEEAKLVNRCIDAIASKVCSEHTVKERIISAFSGGRNLLKPNINYDFAHSMHHINSNSHNPNVMHLNNLNPSSNPNFTSMHQNANNHNPNPNPNSSSSIDRLSPTNCTAIIEWWADEICELRVDLFLRLVTAMKSSGIRNESLGGALIHYANRTLKSLNKKPASYDSKSKVKLTIGGIPTLITSKAMEHEQRILLESIVSMLPQEKYIFSTNFLLSLLRSAVLLDTTVACRLDLERRVGAQLEHASVDDLLIPLAVSHSGGQVGEESCQYDVDVIQRVVTTYLQQNQEEEGAIGGGQVESSSMCESEGGFGSPEGPPHKGIVKVGKLMDLYLAEIAPDPHLKASKFTALAEVLPDYARVLDDGLYRAIDIFLKAHPTLSDMERRKVCKLLDCQKLSQEACTHAAQNERLPVQLVVQVLYFEQLRMRCAMSAGHDHPSALISHEKHIPNLPPLPLPSPRLDPFSSLRRDNRELKLEVARLRLRVNDLEKENGALKEELLCRPLVHASGGGGGGGFFSLISRRFGRMGLFGSSSFKSPRDSSKQSSDSKPPPRRRRHSIS